MKYASSHGTGISRGKHLALRILGVEQAPVEAPQYDFLNLPQYHLPELRGRRGKQRRKARKDKDDKLGGLGDLARENFVHAGVGGSVAEGLFNKGLCLPSGTAMTEEDLDRVISVILSCKR